MRLLTYLLRHNLHVDKKSDSITDQSQFWVLVWINSELKSGTWNAAILDNDWWWDKSIWETGSGSHSHQMWADAHICTTDGLSHSSAARFYTQQSLSRTVTLESCTGLGTGITRGFSASMGTHHRFPTGLGQIYAGIPQKRNRFLWLLWRVSCDLHSASNTNKKLLEKGRVGLNVPFNTL